MKNTIYRVFVTVAVMTATACSDPFADVPNRPATGNSQFQTTEFHTWVTTWYRSDDNGYIGLVSMTPRTDLSKAKFYGIMDGRKILIENLPDATNTAMYREMYNGYLWANVQSNVLMLYFEGRPSSSPPLPLEIVIVY